MGAIAHAEKLNSEFYQSQKEQKQLQSSTEDIIDAEVL
jgi:hypothetical protein